MKYLSIEMENGDLYKVPAELVAKNRAEYYAGGRKAEHLKKFKEETEYALNNISELIDWAHNNMDWKDVELQAIFVSRVVPTAEDLQEGWINGKMKLIEE